MAKYHELGRFAIDDNDIDMYAAFFHERLAADLGVMEAIKTLAHLYLDMPREILVNYEVEVRAIMKKKKVLWSRSSRLSGKKYLYTFSCMWTIIKNPPATAHFTDN